MTDQNSPAQVPATPPPTGTVDITNVVEGLKSSFVTWGVAYVYGLELGIPGLGEIVSLPIISSIDKAAVKEVLTLLASSAIMLAFFADTAIRKASQAQDYVNAVSAKNSLPETASDEEYGNAEKAEMVAFRNFVMVTN